MFRGVRTVNVRSFETDGLYGCTCEGFELMPAKGFGSWPADVYAIRVHVRETGRKMR
jgi:hypothetical protein